MRELHDFGVKLHVLRLLLAHHDTIAEMEVNQHDHLVVRGLEESMLDVLEAVGRR
jgi:hypothetical protein